MAEEEAKGHEGLAGTFREKAISLDTMELRLLLPTAVAIAVVVASAMLLATRDLPWPLVSAGLINAPVLGNVPLPVAVMAGITLVICWSFVLTGALHGHLLFRVVGVAAYAAFGLVSAIEANSVTDSLIIAVVVLSVVAGAVGLYVADRGNHRQAPHLHHRSRLRLPTFGWVFLATALIYVLLALRGFQTGTFAEFISIQLTALQLVLIPVLVLAGTDFAEWGEVVSGRLSSVLERLPRAALVGGLVVVALAVLTWASLPLDGHPGFRLPGAVSGLLPFVLVAPPVALAGGLSLRRSTSTRVPFWALAAGAAVLYLGIAGSSVANFLVQPGPSAPRLQAMVAAPSRQDPEYWLLVPQAWRATAIPDGRVWSGLADGRPARLILLWGPAGSGPGLTSALGVPVSLHPAPPTQGWTTFSVSTAIAGRPAGGEVWTRQSGGRTWTLAGIRAGATTEGSKALFEEARDSWTPDSAGQAEDSTVGDPGYLLTGMSGAAALLAGLGLTLLLMGRGEVATGGLFLTLCGLFTAVGPWVGGEAAQLFRGEQVHISFGVRDLLVVAALAAVPLAALTVAVPRWRLPLPVLRLLFVLLMGFVCLELLYDGVFSTALTAGARFSVIQGVVLVIAMLWDVLMSGESFTNTGGIAAPRHTRVLLYLGYTLMVVTTVLFLTSEQVQGGGRMAGVHPFESDLWPQIGIAALGPPLLLTFFFVNLGAWRRARPPGRPDGLDQVDRAVLGEVRGG